MIIDPSQTKKELSEAVAVAMKGCDLNRNQIADHLNGEIVASGAGKRVSVAMLNKYASPSDDTHSMPSHIIPAFCEITGSQEPMKVLADALGLSLAGPRERELMRLGQAQVDAKRAARLKRMAEAALEEL